MKLQPEILVFHTGSIHEFGLLVRPHQLRLTFENPRPAITGGSQTTSCCMRLRGVPSEFIVLMREEPPGCGLQSHLPLLSTDMY